MPLEGGTAANRLRSLVAHALAWTALGLISAMQTILTYAATGGQVRAAPVLIISLSLWYAWGLLSPVVFWTARKFPLQRAHWTRRLPIYLLVNGLVATCGTLLYSGLRAAADVPARGNFLVILTSNISSAMLVFWSLVALAHGRAYYARTRAREQAALTLERELAQARLQALQSQIHPHFLFNTLHAVAGVVREDPRGAENMLGDLGDLLRSTLAEGPAGPTSLRDELQLIDRYFAIQTVRFRDRLRVTRTIDDAVLDASMPLFLLQPLVENAIEHGIALRRAGGELHIEVAARGDQVLIRIDDNGDHATSAALESTQWSTGLRNTRERLRQVFPTAQLTVRRYDGGVRSEVLLPYKPIRGQA